MKNYFEKVVLNKNYSTVEDLKQNYEADFLSFKENHPGATEGIFIQVLQNTYENINIEGAYIKDEIMKALSSDDKEPSFFIDPKELAAYAIQILRIKEYLRGIALTGTAQEKPILKQRLPDEDKKKSFPKYCKLTALFAQGLISQKDNKYIFKDGNEERLFGSAPKLTAYLVEKYNIDHVEKGLSSIIRDTLKEAGSEHDLYQNAAKMSETAIYCDAENIKVTEHFSEVLETLEKRT